MAWPLKKEQLRLWKEQLCYRYLPSLVDWMVHHSTCRARMRLKRQPLTILLDTNILPYGVTHETQWVSAGRSEQWPVELGQYVRVPVHAHDKRSAEYRNVCHLIGIAHLARCGMLTLKTSSELMTESYRLSAARVFGGGYYDYGVFKGLTIESVDTWPGGFLDLADIADKKQQRARLSASTDPLYERLVELLGPANSQDAWHIRTAEGHACHCLLTMDFKLLRAIDAVRQLEPFPSLKTKVMTPEALGKELGLVPVPTVLLSYHDASFPVRPDLFQPDSKRMK